MSFKRLLSFVIIHIFVLGLAACTQAEDPQPAPTEVPAVEAPAEEEAVEEEPVAEEHAVHWGYEGEGGPDHWVDLEAAYEACGIGVEQSPIDLTAVAMSDLENIVFDYSETAVNILNNGHTIQVNYDEGSSIEINDNTYNLLQFHFHSPSEHAADGTLYPAEMHLVHADADGNLAVVGVFIAEGAENAAFTPVWDNLPAEETEAIATGMMVNATDLLPAEQTIYRYNGSLTTPPCSEGVLWSVMESPVEMSAAQISLFTDIFEGNNRPLQPLNDRDLQLDETP